MILNPDRINSETFHRYIREILSTSPSFFQILRVIDVYQYLYHNRSIRFPDFIERSIIRSSQFSISFQWTSGKQVLILSIHPNVVSLLFNWNGRDISRLSDLPTIPADFYRILTPKFTR